MLRGDVAGIKSATIKFTGEYASGWLRTETGVHRLVRKSPFDSGGRRHTSFCSVFVYPEIDDDIEIEDQPGGSAHRRLPRLRCRWSARQPTESAVRITHIPTGVVVQCQNDRSPAQEQRSVYEAAEGQALRAGNSKQNAEKQALEETKSDIGWGSQIRSYVLDDSPYQGSAHRRRDPQHPVRYSTATWTSLSKPA